MVEFTLCCLTAIPLTETRLSRRGGLRAQSVAASHRLKFISRIGRTFYFAHLHLHLGWTARTDTSQLSTVLHSRRLLCLHRVHLVCPSSAPFGADHDPLVITLRGKENLGPPFISLALSSFLCLNTPSWLSFTLTTQRRVVGMVQIFGFEAKARPGL